MALWKKRSCWKLWTVFFLILCLLSGVLPEDCSKIELNDYVACEKCCCLFQQKAVRVRCKGQEIKDVPQNLPANLTHLTFIETGIKKLISFTKMITIGVNKTKYKYGAFVSYTHLKELYFRDNRHLEDMEAGAFNFNEFLQTDLEVLSILGSPSLKKVKNKVFHNFPKLRTLRITRTGLTEVPEFREDFHSISTMDELDLSFNAIEEVKGNAFPFEHECGELHLEGNQIEVIRNGAFNRSTFRKIYLHQNPSLTTIEDQAFLGTSEKTDFLNLSNTGLKKLPTNGLGNLEELYLEMVPSLKVFPPVLRLSKLRRASLTYQYHCCAFTHPDLQYPAEYEEFQRRIEQECSTTTAIPVTTTAEPTGGFHNGWGDAAISGGLYYIQGAHQSPAIHKRSVNVLPVPKWVVGSVNQVRRRYRSFHNMNEDYIPDYRRNRRRSALLHDLPQIDPFILMYLEGRNRARREVHWNVFKGLRRYESQGFDGFNPTLMPTKPAWRDTWHTSTLDPNETVTQNVSCGLGYIVDALKNVTCTPKPNPFNPCEDIMGYTALRVVVWFVVMAAIFGNLIVLVVTVGSRYQITVGKFLIVNLAFADLCLGFYLLLLAGIDLHSMGVYFNHAVAWQYEGGCQAAGFLAIFSTCLSVFTLTVITMERWYAITHAIHLTKRLNFRHASVVMVCGWLYSIIMGMLPLVGISHYGKTSICLPMETVNPVDKGYVFTLLILNAAAFVIILWCYVDMYCKVRGDSSAAGCNDANIAKRMAVLIFTDFACLFPIAFFGLTAAAGQPLITVSNSKILLVFFFPLNSCANPFLYAIVTKQFRKDLFGMLNRCGVCERRGLRYRSTYTSNHMSVSHSRNSILNHQMQGASNGSVLTTSLADYRCRSSVGGSPRGTPQTTPKENKKQKPTSRISTSFFSNGKKRAAVGNTSEKSKAAVKLSIVPESSPPTEMPMNQPVTLLLPARENNNSKHGDNESPRYLEVGLSESTMVRSVSDYHESGWSGRLTVNHGNKETESKRKDSQLTQFSCQTDSSVLTDLDSPTGTQPSFLSSAVNTSTSVGASPGSERHTLSPLSVNSQHSGYSGTVKLV